LSGPSLDLIAPIRPLQLCADGGYELRLGVLGVPLIMVPDSADGGYQLRLGVLGVPLIMVPDSYQSVDNFITKLTQLEQVNLELNGGIMNF
jgi:hypothetical protein